MYSVMNSAMKWGRGDLFGGVIKYHKQFQLLIDNIISVLASTLIIFIGFSVSLILECSGITLLNLQNIFNV